MNTKTNIIFKEESYQLIHACMEVHKELGPGFLEAVYQEALEIELQRKGIPNEREKELDIYYKGIRLKKRYAADFFCYDKIILETKALGQLAGDNIAQVINYLKATKFRLGLLVNFGEQQLKFKRLVN